MGHNGIQNVPSIGGVVSSSTSMGEDYSYRSGDGFFAQTMEPSPSQPQVVLDANGNPIKIAKNLSAGRKPRKLRFNRMMEAVEEQARTIAKGIRKYSLVSSSSVILDSHSNFITLQRKQ